MCAPGSAYKSGTFDARDFFKTASHGYHYGSGEYWVRPAAMWNEIVEVNGEKVLRFSPVE
ncbi:MAG: DUF1653 domain-containing protein [Kiritimatiellae bacterium]|nr:DUF1653 domain-containing protein [Kiritimatiellia bacterium]